MRIIYSVMIFVILWMLTSISVSPCQPISKIRISSEKAIELPEPKHDGNTSIEKALQNRRSIRNFKDDSLTLAEVSQLLWAAQGVTDPQGFRTTPSAGALYPLEVYVVVGKVNNLSVGVYYYNPSDHELIRIWVEDERAKLFEAAFRQSSIRDCAIVIVISAVYERTTGKYGERGIRYVHMEAGHAAQNVCLQAVSQNLGTVTVGALMTIRLGLH